MWWFILTLQRGHAELADLFDQCSLRLTLSLSLAVSLYAPVSLSLSFTLKLYPAPIHNEKNERRMMTLCFCNCIAMRCFDLIGHLLIEYVIENRFIVTIMKHPQAWTDRTGVIPTSSIIGAERPAFFVCFHSSSLNHSLFMAAIFYDAYLYLWVSVCP